MYSASGLGLPNLVMQEHGFPTDGMSGLGLLPDWKDMNWAFTQWARVHLDRVTLHKLAKASSMNTRQMIDAEFTIEGVNY